MTLQDLESKLQALRLKWANGYPKSVYDPRWPEFRVDKSHALYLKKEIEKIKTGEATLKE